MTVGIQQDNASVNATAGNIAIEVERVMVQIFEFNQFLQATTDAILMASPYNFAQTDINTLRSAFTDFGTLYQIYKGILAPASYQQFDYFRFAKLLAGTRYF